MDAGHIPITVEDWKGIYARGVTDTTPQGYFVDSLNVKFDEGDVFTRDGSTNILTATDIVRFFIYKRLGETVRYIYLNTSGQLFDSLYPDPIWTDVLFLDFSLCNFNNRAYITPHNRTTGIAGKSILVYDGSGTARLAACSTPVGFTLGAAVSATSGNVEAGTHLLAVCFETSSGFISAPGPVSYAVLSCPGGFSIDLSSLPIGPSGTVARRIVATQAIQDYNGNQNGYQFFLVSSTDGGRIADNSSTTATISFFDAELIADATYLFSTRATIPAGCAIMSYNGRMVILGINGDEHSAYISKPYDPEAMSTLTGFITVDPFESGDGLRNAFVYRGNIVFCKPNRLYQTSDNQSDPVTWTTPVSIDQGTGAECFCVGTILDSKGQQSDRCFIADRSGMVIYEGYVRRPEGSWLIKNLWDRINKALFNLIQVAVDAENSEIFISVPLDDATSISHILYGYYGDAYGPYGFDQKLIKWSVWSTTPGVSCITVDIDQVTGTSVLKYSGSSDNIYKIASDYSVHSDDGVAYESYVQTALFTSKPKYTQHCNLLNVRVLGSGILLTSLFGQDNIASSALANANMSATSSTDVELKANFESTRISVEFSTGSNIDEYFKISRMDLYLKPRWLSLPS